VTDDEFQRAAMMELSSRDATALAQALRDGSGLIGAGIKELLRLHKAQEVFPGMSLMEMWATDRALAGQKQGRPTDTDLQRLMRDPAWAAVGDLEHLKGLWRELRPGKQVPVEFLTDIVVRYRDVDRSAVVARRSRPKSRRISDQ
jgi:hypothetical protein